LHNSFIIPYMIKLVQMGSSVNYPDRSSDDIFTNSHGLGSWVFMHFTTPFRVKTPKGIMERAAGEFLINSPDYPQWHQGIDECFKNDWFIYNGDTANALMQQVDLPLNIPFSASHSENIVAQFNNIHREYILCDKFWKEKIDSLITALFYDLSRLVSTGIYLYMSKREKELLPIFQQARITIQQSVKQQWNIESMAKLVDLSPNRFAVLYRNFFQISPIQDLVEARLHLAQTLLLNHSAKIEAVADQCGFSSIHYFWRVFKRRFAISPSAYRNSEQ